MPKIRLVEIDGCLFHGLFGSPKRGDSRHVLHEHRVVFRTGFTELIAQSYQFIVLCGFVLIVASSSCRVVLTLCRRHLKLDDLFFREAKDLAVPWQPFLQIGASSDVPNTQKTHRQRKVLRSRLPLNKRPHNVPTQLYVNTSKRTQQGKTMGDRMFKRLANSRKIIYLSLIERSASSRNAQERHVRKGVRRVGAEQEMPH